MKKDETSNERMCKQLCERMEPCLRRELFVFSVSKRDERLDYSAPSLRKAIRGGAGIDREFRNMQGMAAQFPAYPK
ncbi:MAG: hypothetical protein ACO1PZ_03895 [Gammaproteobacteria bacterium]